MKKNKNNYFHKVNKVLLSIYLSIACILPVFSVPVHAEDITLYWDGIFFAYNDSQIIENAVSAHNTGARALFPVAPTHHLIWTRNTSYNIRYTCYWLLATSNTNEFSAYSDTRDNLNTLLRNNSKLVKFSPDGSSEESLTFTNYTFEDSQGVYYYCILCDVADVRNPIVAGHISYVGDAGVNTTDPGVFAFGGINNLENHKYIEDIYYENPGFGFFPDVLYNWASSGTYPEITSLSFFSQSVKDYMYSLDSYRPSGGFVDLDNPSGGVTPEGEGGGEGEGEGEGGSSSSGSSSLSQQQQQMIAEGAVQNSQSIEAGAVQNTIQSGAVQITNNAGGGVTSGLDQAAAGGFFDNVQTGFNGLKSVVQSLGQMPEAVGGFLSFLPDELLNAFYLCFSLIIPLILIKLVI